MREQAIGQIFTEPMAVLALDSICMLLGVLFGVGGKPEMSSEMRRRKQTNPKVVRATSGIQRSQHRVESFVLLHQLDTSGWGRMIASHHIFKPS